MSGKLLSPYRLGPLELPNRVVMAPMTRNRAAEGDVPRPLNAEYYRQRASAGLLITEGAPVSPQGVGYPRTPGLYTPEQIAGWKQVNAAVHQAGGRIFCQLWHVGRISHPSLQPDHALPVAPSAIAPEGETVTYEGMQPFVTPRALALEEIPGVIEQFRQAAINAREAGFDGVEIHGANGYLLDQFLRDGTNRRSDAYGGSLENRARLLLEVTEAVCGVWGAERVGVRLSPLNAFNSIHDSDPPKTFAYAVEALNRFGLAYLHLMEANTTGPEQAFDMRTLYEKFEGTVMVNAGYDQARAEAVLEAGADLVAFGVPYIANPDLVERFARGVALNEADPATFYGGDAAGYTDYPAMAG